MANQHGNGRNAPSADESRPSWRPQDENGARHRRTGDHERTYGDEERFAARERERMGAQWDDRSARYDDREDRHRGTEWHGQGQSGYASGRYEGDRSYGSRNEMYPTDPDVRDRGTDDRFTGRGGYAYREDRATQGGRGGGSYGAAGNMGAVSTGGGHRGKGPSGYARSDERIREIVCEALTDDDHIDATHIDVSVHDGEVTLSGSVADRSQKRMAHHLVDNLSGVRDVVNQLRIGSDQRDARSGYARENATSEGATSSDRRNHS